MHDLDLVELLRDDGGPDAVLALAGPFAARPRQRCLEKAVEVGVAEVHRNKVGINNELYRVLVVAEDKSQLCRVHSSERRVEVDHVLPTHGGLATGAQAVSSRHRVATSCAASSG